jgi:hypothetical protein
MAIVETQIHETEDESVARWRLDQLLLAGYEEMDALVLSELVDVDLHAAVDLVSRGCPSDTALRILL